MKAFLIPKYKHITGERAREIANFIVKYLFRVAQIFSVFNEFLYNEFGTDTNSYNKIYL